MTRYLLTLLTLFTLMSCSDDTTSTGSGNGKNPGTEQTIPVAQGEMIESSEIKGDIHIFSNPEDTLTFTFEAKAGKSYKISLHYFNVPTQKVIISPNGDSLTGSFACTQSGSYRVNIFPTHPYSDDQTASVEYSIREMNSTASLNGKWLITQEAYTTKDHSHSKYYSDESAHILMEIRNDSIFYVGYNNFENDKISGEPFIASQSLPNMKYRVDKNSLIFEQNNSYAHLTYEYKKFNGNINDIVWEDELFEVQNEALGSWYLASETSNRVEFVDGEKTEDPDTRNYSFAADSRLIYTFTGDEVTEYFNNFDEDVSFTSSSFSKRSLLRNSHREGDNLIFEKSTFYFFEDERSYVSYYKEVYTKYEGELFPSKWSEITVPNEISPFEINKEYSLNLNDHDTLWYEIDLDQGYYQLDYTASSDDDIIRAYIIDKPAMKPKHLLPHEQVSAGRYYLVLITSLYNKSSSAVISLKSL